MEQKKKKNLRRCLKIAPNLCKHSLIMESFWKIFVGEVPVPLAPEADFELEQLYQRARPKSIGAFKGGTP